MKKLQKLINENENEMKLLITIIIFIIQKLTKQ